nr:type II toxin-antitoxin system RelE/ParE family toxin [Phyllobacterium sp. OV277]
MRIKQTDTYRVWERKLRDDRAKAAIAARLFRLVNSLIGDVSSVSEGVYELRIHYGPGYRVYFKQCSAELVILLCGGNKRTQQRDIRKAKLLAAEWKSDNGNEAL